MTPAQVKALTQRLARKYHIPFFVAQIGAESNFNEKAGSPAGAQGAAQIMPATAKGWGVDPWDTPSALEAAARNMRRYVDKYGVEGALRAYNAGPGAIEKSKGFAETNAYVRKILSHGGGDTSGMDSGPAEVSGTSPDPGTSAPNIFETIGQLGALQPKNPQQEQLQRGWQLLAQLQDQQQQASPVPSYQGTPQGPSGPAAPVGRRGVGNFEGTPVARWIAPALRYARRQGWTGQVNSGYRSRAEQQRIWDSGVRPAARPGTSNHENPNYPGGAVDVSEAEALSEILKNSRWRKRLRWAGSRDPVHFSHPHGGSY